MDRKLHQIYQQLHGEAQAPIRLPIQHCTACKAPLPNLNSTQLTMGHETSGFEILAMTLRIRCKCGAEWILRKVMK
jgi:hypothetical protein